MSLCEKLNADMKEAMKNRDSLRRETIRGVRGAIRNKEIEIGKTLDDDGILRLIRTLVKQRMDSIEQYQAALHLGPDYHDLRYRLARLLLEAGRSLESREELQRVVQARPDSTDVRLFYGLACYVSGDAATAKAVWEELASRDSEDVRAQAYLAMLSRGAQA